MSAANQMPLVNRERPLIAVVCSVPLLGEAVAASLDFADVRVFSARDGDISGLFRSLKPDSIVVDSDVAAQEAATYAAAYDLAVAHIDYRSGVLRLYDREWRAAEEGTSPEGIRNLVAPVLFAREVTA